MSVINQMLKDLEQRNTDAPSTNTTNVTVQSKSSNTKSIVVTVIIVMLLNAAGFFVWSLYSENQSLKTSVTNANNSQGSTTGQHKKNVDRDADIAKASAIENKANNQLAEQTQSNIKAGNSNLPTKKSAENARASVLAAQSSRQTEQVVQVAEKNIENGAAIQSVNSVEQASIDIVAIESAETQKQTATRNADIKDKSVQEVKTKPLAAKNQSTSVPKMTISRKQLTADELAQQKMLQAEKAIEANDMVKAEQLFEDILLIQPENKEARKQLAALWYGRQSYQSAVNLLTQGINLNPQYAEFRLMQAKLYLAQGSNEQAYQTLVSLPNEQDSEYQLTLANSAQQLGKFAEAITAYQVLVNLQPLNSRWWLGLAVALDSNSEFVKAKTAYQSALSNGGLSESSVDFIRQRLTELGE